MYYSNTLDHYGLEAIRKSLEGSEITFPLAIELLFLELIHRFVVCAFEVYNSFFSNVPFNIKGKLNFRLTS